MNNLSNLEIKEAKELCKKAQKTSNEETKQLYIEKLLLGTNYLIDKYIKKLKLDTLENSSYDIDDIKSSFTMAWYNSIINGDILKKKKYDDIFLSEKFLKDFYTNLIGNNYNDKANIYDFKMEKLRYLFGNYDYYKQEREKEEDKKKIESILKHVGSYSYKPKEYKQIDISKELIKCCWWNSKDNVAPVIDIFEQIFYTFNVNSNSIPPYLYELFLKLLVKQKSEEHILDSNEALTKISDDENTLFHSLLMKEFSDTIKNELKNENERIAFTEKYGLNDGVPKKADEIAEVIDKSPARTRQLADLAFKKIIQNTNVLRYAPDKNKGDN